MPLFFNAEREVDMKVYGDPEMLYGSALVFLRIAERLQEEDDQERVSREALQYIRTAIIHNAPSSRPRRKRPTQVFKFSLIGWHTFKADTQYRNKKSIALGLMRTLRRIQKGLPVALMDRIAAVNFFWRLSEECVRKGDSSRMA